MITAIIFAQLTTSFAQSNFRISPHGYDTICHGKTIGLEAMHGFHNYYWSNGKHDRIIQVSAAGKYTCTANDSNGNMFKDSIMVSLYPEKHLEINSNPAQLTICKGGKVILEASAGFLSYSWSKQLSGHRIEIYPEATTWFLLEAVDSNYCSYRDSVHITVKDTCQCSGIIHYPKTTLCGEHDSIHLEASKGYVAYEWSNKSHDRLIWAKTQGWYWVGVIDSTGHHCRDSIFINHSALPAIHINTNPDPPKICKGNKIVLEASSGFKEYSWSNSMHGSRLEFAPEKTIELSLEAVTELGCQAHSSIKITVDSCLLGISNQSYQSIKIYPNPVTNHVLNISSDELEIKGIQILDLTGKEIKTVMTNNSSQIEIQLQNSSNGVLLLKIYFEKSVITRLISVE